MSLERYYLSVVSGERRGPLAAVVRALLRVATLFYALALAARRLAYASGLKRPARAPCPVLSVGNIVAGGTGKTPMVEHLARRLLARGRRPAIVSRGYKARVPGAANDEVLLLGANLPEVPHVIDAERARGAALAVAKHAADAVILDDGFQHWRVARDLDLVLIDALAPFGHGALLPRGLLREPLAALRRADAIAITRADLCSAGRLAEIRAEVRRHAPDAPVVEVVEEVVGTTAVAGRKLFAFCGIGNPEGFFLRLERLGAEVVGRRAFGDHHPYTAAEIAEVREAAKAAGAEAIVTTQKDAVKLGEIPGAAEIVVLKIRAAIRSGEAELEACLDRALEKRRTQSAQRPAEGAEASASSAISARSAFAVPPIALARA